MNTGNAKDPKLLQRRTTWRKPLLNNEAASRAREGLTRDDVLDNVTLYWLTNTTVSSAGIYWENKFAFFAPKHVVIPVAVSAFSDEVVQTPRSWAEHPSPRFDRYLIVVQRLDW